MFQMNKFNKWISDHQFEDVSEINVIERPSDRRCFVEHKKSETARFCSVHATN